MTEPVYQPRRRRRMPGEERYRQLLDIATKVFADLGYSRAGTADIARAAGVAEPTIYRHFPSKRDLFLTSVRRAWEQIFDGWHDAAQQAADPLSALRGIVQRLLQQLRESPEAAILHFRSIHEADDPEVRQLAQDIYRQGHSFVLDLYRQAQARGQLAPGADPEALAGLFMGLLFLYIVAQMLGLWDLFTPQRQEAMLRAVLGAKT
ncbi:MAG: TetR/AcrR family transcriptional regulator [Dehalococcoidia bacterium]|jgi:TetR/AcrR family transcriptional regulator|nr:TetR/AcrR family transcriptional regulator [Dehalococcoidia bacterium]MDW8009388.1 TetR/AcrR family transcriptional regulator [Chloroflexota bacterium]